MKMDLALDNLQMLICHKTEQNQTKPNHLKHRQTDRQIKTYLHKKKLVVFAGDGIQAVLHS